MTAFERFALLHRGNEVLVLPNAWDALSARLVESEGAKAIATSSAALAWARGYPDGERLPLDALCQTIADMARVVRVPISVDFVQGYAHEPSNDAVDAPEACARAVERVVEAGACGVNIEDGGGDPALLAAKIRAVKARLPGRVFVNARTCVLLHGNASADELVTRAAIYEQAGADGFFVIRLGDEARIRAVARATELPLNVHLEPSLPAPSTLASWGVRRLSAGIFIARAAYASARQAARSMLTGELHGEGVSADLTYVEANGLMRGPDAAAARNP